MNLPLLALIFIIPLQNIYLGKFPSLGGGVNLVNILLLLAFFSASKQEGTTYGSEFNGKIWLLFVAYTVSAIWAYVYLGYDPNLFTSLKDIFFAYMFFFLVYRACDGVKTMKIIFWASVLPLLYMFKVFYSNLSWMGLSSYSDKLRFNSGTFMELGSNEIAAFYATYTFVIVAIAFQEADRRLRWLLLTLAGMNVYCLVYAFSRGAYLASLIGLLVFALLSRKTKHLFTVAALLISLSVIGFKVVPKSVTERFDSTFNSVEERDESAQSRLVLWDIAIDAFAENPILGIGFGNFRKVNPYHKDTHNYYVKMLVEGGVIGFSLLAAFLVAALRRGILLYRIARDPFLKALATGFIACMTALLIGNFFGDRFTHYPLISYFFVYLAMVVKGIEWSKQGDGEAYPSPASNQQ